MKYIYWVCLSLLVVWETHALQDIFDFSPVWQHVANIISVGYFAYLLNIKIDFNKLTNKYLRQRKVS
ncbi:hypothetical protein [Amphibacillus sediminis]|uniref:hypothetical protein n=1 Tax=Amphibacillus sediminis TaxID=360185 RepID=UPI0008339A01|nr:hypothetical protein [Amphibacillus sediminis]